MIITVIERLRLKFDMLVKNRNDSKSGARKQC